MRRDLQDLQLDIGRGLEAGSGERRAANERAAREAVLAVALASSPLVERCIGPARVSSV